MLILNEPARDAFWLLDYTLEYRGHLVAGTDRVVMEKARAALAEYRKSYNYYLLFSQAHSTLKLSVRSELGTNSVEIFSIKKTGCGAASHLNAIYDTLQSLFFTKSMREIQILCLHDGGLNIGDNSTWDTKIEIINSLLEGECCDITLVDYSGMHLNEVTK